MDIREEINEEAERVCSIGELTISNMFLRDKVYKMRSFILNGAEYGYITVPEEGDPAFKIYNELFNEEQK